MKFREFIQTESILVPLQSNDREGVIRELVQSLGQAGAVEPDAVEEVIKALITREKSGTTGFGRGVAAPHCKHPRVRRLVGTVGLSEKGIEFNALDHKPVYAVFMLLSPQGQDQLHLQAMEVIFRNLKEDMFRRLLRQTNTKEKLAELLDEIDAK
jgi:mannitol/fructose-specific phosphotransferase system IIA component (Ntr-type)